MTPARLRTAAVLLLLAAATPLAAVAAWAGPALVGPDVALAAHRATYELTLDNVHGGQTVAASGHMTYQVSDACSSWATQQELRLRTVTRDGGAVELVSEYATLESKDGRHLAFDMKQRSNNVVTQELRGEAVLDPSGAGRIRYVLPQKAIVTLPAGTLFPMAHTAAIIRAARAGLKSIAPILFDGTGTDGAQDTYVTILGWQPAPSPTSGSLPLADKASSSSRPELAGLGSSRVHVAFFSRSPGTITPDYESAMRYFDNGVADQLRMDFGSFTMMGTMHGFSLPKSPARC